MSVEPVSILRPVHLTHPGRITSITCHIFVAGKVELLKGRQAANRVKSILSKRFGVLRSKPVPKFFDERKRRIEGETGVFDQSEVFAPSSYCVFTTDLL